MTTKKSTKRALLTSALSLVLCISLLIGTTFAWFTDSVTSANNRIQAGNLKVDLLMDKEQNGTYVSIANENGDIFNTSDKAQNASKTLWEPGKTQIAYLAIKNTGNLALKYTVALDVENVSKNLYEVMEYAITPDAQYDAKPAWTGGNAVVTGTQAVSQATSLAAGATHYFALSVHMLETAENQYMNGEINFDLTVLATQDTVEADSFGPDYDAAADAVQVDSADALVNAINEGETEVSLKNDIALTNQLEITDELTIYGNGKTITAPVGGTRVVNAQNQTEDVTINLVGVTLNGDDVERGISFYNNTGDLNVTIANSEISAKYYGVNVAGGNTKATLNIKNSSLIGYCGFQTWSANTVATFDNCVITGVNTSYNNPQYPYSNDFATIVINRDADNCVLTFNKCTIVATEKDSASAPSNQWPASQAHVLDKASNTTVNWNNCTFIRNGVEVNAAVDLGDLQTNP